MAVVVKFILIQRIVHTSYLECGRRQCIDDMEEAMQEEQKEQISDNQEQDDLNNRKESGLIWKKVWEKNWEIPLFFIAIAAFLLLLFFYSGKVGFYLPVSGNSTGDTIALLEDGRCDAIFMRDGIDGVKTDFPSDTKDTEAASGEYSRWGNIVWMRDRYLGIGVFSYLIVIDTKYHVETRDILNRMSVWKRTSMENPRTEKELERTIEQLSV